MGNAPDPRIDRILTYLAEQDLRRQEQDRRARSRRRVLVEVALATLLAIGADAAVKTFDLEPALLILMIVALGLYFLARSLWDDIGRQS